MVMTANRTYKCPKCNAGLGVIDSRPTEFMGESTIRRRRCCPSCDYRFTTYEISEANLMKHLDIAEKSKLFAKSIIDDVALTNS